MSTRFHSTELNPIPRLLGWLGLILMCCFTGTVFASQVTLAWDPSSSPDVGGYKVVYGQSSGAYTSEVDVGKQTSNTVANLDDSKTYYFAVRAYNTDKTVESVNSNEVSKPASATTPPPSTALPSPWINMDIGNVGLVGSASYANGAFTVKGSGDDIWNTADAFHFAYQPLSGDGSIVARVASITNTDSWAKVGVMIRESLDANARHAMVAVTAGNGVAFQRRTATGGSSTHTAGATVATPYWVKLARSGNTFTAYQSVDGASWAQIGSATLSMATGVYVGLAVTSHNNSALNASVLDNVNVQAGNTSTSPTTVQYTFDSQPSGLNLTYDGVSRATPFTVDAVVNSQHSIGAPASQSNYNFNSWSDSGAATHTITIGASPQTLSANYVVATPAPTADFSANQTSGGAPLTVNFTDQSSGSVTGWAWTFGDGGTSTAQNPSHTYTQPGIYPVVLTVTGPGGSDDETKTNYITVKEAKPTASFTASPSSGLAPLLVTFVADASTGGGIDSYAWTFSDNTTASGSNVVKTFDAGTHTATLTVTGPGGSATETQTITATTAVAPTVNFSATPTSGPAPLTVSFVNGSSGDIQSWSWSFGDGGTSTARNPSHAYDKEGTYTVSLTATSSTGTKVTKTLADYVTVSPANTNTGGLVAAYSFNEGSGMTVVDASGNGNDGVVSGATYTSGKFDFALSFGGTKYVSVPNSKSLNIEGTDLTISFFANITNTGKDQILIDKPWDATSYPYPYYQYGVEFMAGSKAFVLFLGDTGGSYHMYSMSAPLGTWTHVTFTYDGANVKGYVDGVLMFTTPATFSIQPQGNPLRIGLDHTGGQPANGSLDEIRIYNRALTASEIQADMNNPIATASTGSDILEAGEITLNGGWQQVKFAKPFSDPVVVANPLNFEAAEPGVIRIRNVNATGFEIRSQAWDYLGGSSVAGKVGYLAVERGSHTLDDGTQIEAGRVDTSLTGSFGKVTFAKPFSVAPVVITGVASVNEESAVVTRMKNVTGASFYVGMQEEEANVRVHATETIAYIAWQPSSGTVEGLDFQVGRTASIVTDKFYTVAYPKAVTTLPVFLADMQTTNGGDTANLRWQNKTLSSVQVKVAEEQSKGSETTHGKEVVGYILLTPKQ